MTKMTTHEWENAYDDLKAENELLREELHQAGIDYDKIRAENDRKDKRVATLEQAIEEALFEYMDIWGELTNRQLQAIEGSFTSRLIYLFDDLKQALRTTLSDENVGGKPSAEELERERINDNKAREKLGLPTDEDLDREEYLKRRKEGE